ncbi:M23 family metallopeptidase [Phycicoccus sp. Root101]|uniref:M23 family metallopeptidase n=1 Tax=Phycicoccus sp. Root101 TaxID=1736421 RepID=UPI000B1D2F9F|nr:peptidoglycan DD-metalloendopeptidase family protein [Phycicoccus sp. Root101]
MRSLASVLLLAAAAALAVTTVSTVVAPARTSVEPPQVATGGAPAPPVHDTHAALAAPTGDGPVPQVAPRGRWMWPLTPRPSVARPFVRPATTWGAGHRGVDLTSSQGSAVRAVDAGVVAHVGVVAGRGTVTVLHRSGLRSTYEPVDPGVAVGDEVGRGQVIGTVSAGGHCLPSTCLHLGALRGTRYLDPMTLLGAARVRLLPLR